MSKKRRYRRSRDREILDIKIKSAVADRNLVREYERRITDLQFDKIAALNQEHATFHQREHLLYEEAVSRATLTITSQVSVLEADILRMREESHGYLPVDRFEREHKALTEKTETAAAAVIEKVEASAKSLSDKLETSISTVNQRLGTEEKVTVRQDATQALLDKISQNNRWLIGVAATAMLSLLATAVHLFGIIK